MTEVITKAVEGSNLIPFSFEGTEVRVLDQTGEPWWVLTDVCQVLEIANSRDAATRLDDDEKDDVGITDAIGREQKTTIINESGLWSLVLTSRKLAAKRFKKWITTDVIPSIRKTGSYTMTAPETPEQLAMRALTGLQAVVAKQQEQLAIAAPKAAALDRISLAEGSYGLTQTAKILQVGPKALNTFLSMNRWIYRFNGNKHWLAYEDKRSGGLLRHKLDVYTDQQSGEEKSRDTVRVTIKGIIKLAKIVPGAQIDPEFIHLVKETPIPFAKKPELVS